MPSVQPGPRDPSQSCCSHVNSLAPWSCPPSRALGPCLLTLGLNDDRQALLMTKIADVWSWHLQLSAAAISSSQDVLREDTAVEQNPGISLLLASLIWTLALLAQSSLGSLTHWLSSLVWPVRGIGGREPRAPGLHSTDLPRAMAWLHPTPAQL